MSRHSEEVIEKITQAAMPKVMADDFSRYAKAVLTDRAIPDVRDGLKPVQRRIIFGMYEQGIFFDKPTRKCATIVGYVMGNYHPHGDASIYDALVRLSQDWKMEAPLVAFQGNNGSIDNDPPAASRYTEAKLSKIADLMVEDLDKDTVPMQLNFSDERLEPTVLPARFPNLLVNGAQGIAVGAATNIPTHNLGEVIDATVYAISHKRATVADLRRFILGPDFPTGGVIDQPEALDALYETGSASFYIHADAAIDAAHNRIVITGLPYGTVKSDFVAALDRKRTDAHIDNIAEIRDESAEDVRIVIDVREGQDPAPILSYLRTHGLLRSTFAANMLAINKGHPRTMNVLDIIHAYIAHQQDVVMRRSRYDLAKDTKRLEIVDGLIRAVDIIDGLIKVIKASKGKAEAKANIMAGFGFTADQAEAIVMLNLYKISSLDYEEFKSEQTGLRKEIDELNRIIAEPDYLDGLLIRDLQAVKAGFAVPRRTKIAARQIKAVEVDATSLIAKEDVYAVVTRDGYIKRTNLRSYQASVTGSYATDLPKIKQGDGIVLAARCSTHDGLLAFLSTGTFVYVPVYAIPEAKWKEEGKHLNTLVRNLSGDDRIVSAFSVSAFVEGAFVCLLSKEGKIKRTPLADFAQTRLTPRSIRAMGLGRGDQLLKALVTGGNSDLIVMQSNGYVTRFNENEVPAVGLKAGGVKAMNLGKGNPPLADMTALDSDEHARLLIVTDKGAVRAVMSTNIDPAPRLSGKLALVKIFKSSPMEVVALLKLPLRHDGGQTEVCAYTDDADIAIDIKSLETVLPGSGMKAALNLPPAALIHGLHCEGTVIGPSFRIEKPKPAVDTLKARDETGSKQLSLFDLFDEEDGK